LFTPSQVVRVLVERLPGLCGCRVDEKQSWFSSSKSPDVAALKMAALAYGRVYPSYSRPSFINPKYAFPLQINDNSLLANGNVHPGNVGKSGG